MHKKKVSKSEDNCELTSTVKDNCAHLLNKFRTYISRTPECNVSICIKRYAANPDANLQIKSKQAKHENTVHHKTFNHRTDKKKSYYC